MSERAVKPMQVMVRELLTVVDLLALLNDPIFYGVRAPRGDGKLVAVIPGMFGSDSYLQPLNNWLRRLGYTPLESTLSMNAGCMQKARRTVQTQIDRYRNGAARPIALIGHSRGGALAWAIAAQMQERVSHLVLLGAPIPTYQRAVEAGELELPAGHMSQMLLDASRFSRGLSDPDCKFPSCECAYVDDAGRPLSPSTAVLSIYGRDDLLVPEQARMAADQRMEAPTGHVGLVYNPEVYRAVGKFLSTNGATQ
jgi:pimeloyl-ACP methyl ester carboxylesterase